MLLGIRQKSLAPAAGGLSIMGISAACCSVVTSGTARHG